MPEESANIYNEFHRAALQILLARNAVTKKEFELEIIPRLNSQFKTSYQVAPVISMINNKLRDIGFSINESVCDDGYTYYCFINTTSDFISAMGSLSKEYLCVLRYVVELINEYEGTEGHDDNLGISTLRCLLDAKTPVGSHDTYTSLPKDRNTILSELFTYNWLSAYKCSNKVTVIGGPRLIAELGNWLVNVVQLPECPICMDPVVGGLHCPHCGTALHRRCAYRSLVSLETTGDDVEKGFCPSCHERWIAELDNFTNNGFIYRS
ncbi:hypothetical protein AV274_2505 [Blastocystis sp. ATCC 50177/Nand II]|uniref:Non-structural maintenance of chromosomes element 1 homolog n=1 Tax=Blastocystis sp. subtype 1 (strain ATCC 50177 / NandII) TaxID=478820 RepID=A0A196SFF2_BLAHN|nr:hypothetical protein AV274_2505 [Blastocystis sp. ATCC 50177/Nand II]